MGCSRGSRIFLSGRDPHPPRSSSGHPACPAWALPLCLDRWEVMGSLPCLEGASHSFWGIGDMRLATGTLAADLRERQEATFLGLE